ncbi:MAG: ribonuclease J [Acidimicrobiaceae bacterium]|nr:ribonuclease J [Acidimicrobiaceae bacterium]MCY4175002.1 ribonuclease J [Acidimicrobiaceae bacterium]MCY4280175.1 ribonuclease J [Acidimicrobiaceae bacterium]MCY4293679.1 ribonuclease J [Acidimicrobiaceae bacterium]
MAATVAVTFLGGLGEIGRNCAVLETSGRRVLLDCGRMFAGDDLPGVESVIPDFRWLLDRGGPSGPLEACVVTHAHEDHIGALPHLLERLQPELPALPVYGSDFTLGLLNHKLSEAGLRDRAEPRRVGDGDSFKAGPFECEVMPVTHSVPGGLITAFTTPQGVILHSSDFKLDLTPVDGRRTALSRIGALAHDPGVRLLLADSTNADAPGSSRSEREVGEVLREAIAQQAGRRLIVGAFASHIHRVQQVIEAASAVGRTVATLGRSMQRNVALARELGLLRIPDSALCDISDLEDLPPGRVLIVCTGSQGEPLAALTQMAEGANKWVDVTDTDTVILSSHPIPGNEAAVAALRNGLARRGARVLHTGNLDVHTTGHGQQQELKVLHSVASPEWFVPVHGEYSHLVAHAGLAQDMGMPAERVLVCCDGDRIELSDGGLSHAGSVGGGHVYVDGTVGDLGSKVLAERRKAGADGFVAVAAGVAPDRGALVSGPRIKTHGWVEEPALRGHEAAVADAVAKELKRALAAGERERDALEDLMMRTARRTSRERTRRRPVIVAVVTEH